MRTRKSAPRTLEWAYRGREINAKSEQNKDGSFAGLFWVVPEQPPPNHVYKHPAWIRLAGGFSSPCEARTLAVEAAKHEIDRHLNEESGN